MTAVYLDSISPEEKAEFDWLKEHSSGSEVDCNDSGERCVCFQETDEKILAIGQKAAWFTGSRILSIWYRAAVCMDLTESAERQN